MDLLKKRAEIILEHGAMERHDPHWKDEAAKGRKISERPVAFLCNKHVVIVGDCAKKVLDKLEYFLSWANGNQSFQDRMEKEPTARDAVVEAEALVEAKPKEIRVTTQEWNSLMLGLNEIGFMVAMSDGAE